MSRILKSGIFITAILLQIILLGLAPQTDVDLSKIHPRFHSLVSGEHKLSVMTKSGKISEHSYIDAEGKERFGIIVKTDNIQSFQETNINYNSVFESFVTAKVTIEELKLLSTLPDIEYIDAPSINYPKTNVSLPENGTSLVHNGAVNNTAYKGKGAIVLIFDTGIDWNHIDFKNPQDTTESRILYIWDQTIGPVYVGESNPPGFNYGVEYTKSDIDDEIDGTPTGDVREKDSNGHGTHVAGTAAGSGSKFKGIAPEADIIIVKGGDESFSEVHIIDAIKYAEDKADARGQPIVVNLSLGGQDGPHDGSRPYEQVIDNFSSKSGRVVVVSAGNDGADEIHIPGNISSGGNSTIQITVPTYTPESGLNNDFQFNLWYDGSATVTAKITSPSGVTYQQTNSGGYASEDRDGKIWLENLTVSGNKRTVGLDVSDASLTKPPAEGTWTLELIGASGSISYDGWLSINSIGEPASRIQLQYGDNNKSVSMPGTANKSITVGAYVTKITWPSVNGGQYSYTDDDKPGDIAKFSSQGPTRDGRLKPEITASGKGIVAALSQQLDEAEDDVWINPDNNHFLTQGTSMSAPHVTGASALLLSNNPSLTVDEIKSLLGSTAKTDNYTQTTPNNTWGYGKMNILQALTTQETQDSVITRKIVNYANSINGPYHEVTGSERLAVRYTAPFSGQISGAYLTTLINHADVNPIISGKGNLLVSVHKDEGGFPGTVIGSVVEHPLSLLDAGTDNYINLLDGKVTVQSGEYYHIVFMLSNGEDTLKIRFDSGASDYLINYSEIYLQGQWSKLGDVFSSAYNLLLKSENIMIEYVNAIDDAPVKIARTFRLDQNYPNPFNPSTTIRFSLIRRGPVNLSIFDVLGREVVKLTDKVTNAGSHEIIWDGKNRHGNQVPTGIYFYRLKTNEGVLSKKMLMVK